LIGGGFQRPSSASGLGAYRRIVFLHWLLNVYKVPAELSDARYGVRYTNPTYDPWRAEPGDILISSTTTIIRG
jgi:hypothetical protein